MGLMFALSACQQVPPRSAPLHFPLVENTTPCLANLPRQLPLGEAVLSECDGLRWTIASQYWSALNEPCVIVTQSAQQARWCFANGWRALPKVLAHE